MNTTRAHNLLAAVFSLVLTTAFAATTGAQEVLPKPEPAFKSTIGATYKESKPDFPKPLQHNGVLPS
jgi:arylsulfatase